jgi:hypothetical protein
MVISFIISNLLSYHLMLFQLPNRMLVCISTETIQMGHPEPRSKTRALLVGKSEPDIPAGDSRRVPVVSEPQFQWSQERLLRIHEGDCTGDLIFSFVDTRIIAIGRVVSYCYESPKPVEFGEVGLNWQAIGWRVRVNFTSLVHRVRPKDHIDLLRSMLPARYSPLQGSGNGVQSIYLTEVQAPLAETLIGRIGAEAIVLARRSATLNPEESVQTQNADMEVWEHHIEAAIESDSGIPDTDREALIVARRGQGLFKHGGTGMGSGPPR